MQDALSRCIGVHRAGRFSWRSLRQRSKLRLSRWVHGWTARSGCATLSRAAAQFLTLFSLVYCAWHYGGGDPTALQNVCILLAVALPCTLLAVCLQWDSRLRLPMGLLLLLLLPIGLAIFQQSSLAGRLGMLTAETARLRTQFANEAIQPLADAARRMDGQTVETELISTGSIDSHQTQLAIVPLAIAFVIALLSAILFSTSRSRQAFLFVLIVNGTALAFWGIAQKSSGGHSILPGVENTFTSASPFSSFIYKNAGAAALIPCLAAAVAVLYQRLARSTRTKSYRSSSSAQLLEPTSLALFGCVALMLVGLCVSLSRGAWIATLLAALCIVFALRRSVFKRSHLIAGSIAGVVGLGVISLVGLHDEVRGRIEAFSIDYLFQDQRWPQWIDGSATALAHLPMGSGLGTYGYATLPVQTETRRSWFQQAHNQYLETVTEMGIPGVIGLVVVISLLAMTVRRLLRRRDRESRRWGLVGLVLLIAGGFQSLFDFVIAMPANLMVYTSLFAVLCTLHASTRSRPLVSVSFPAGLRSPLETAWLRSPVLWSCSALAVLFPALQLSHQQVYSENVLRQTSVAVLSQQPTAESISLAQQRLDQAIAEDPTNGTLYLRRAQWHVADYRLQLLEVFRLRGYELAWDDTRLENLSAILLNQPPARQSDLSEDLTGLSPLRRPLAAASRDLAGSLQRMPLSPKTHLACGQIATLVDLPLQPHLHRTARLANNSGDLLYLNGSLACFAGDHELAIDQWERSLSISHKYIEPIYAIASSHYSATTIASRLIPANRTDLYLRLLRATAVQSDDIEGPVQYDQELGKSLIRMLTAREDIDRATRSATKAEIHFLLGDYVSEALSWKVALQFQPRQPRYRLRYSHALLRIGDTQEALKQAVLGKTLNPLDDRFQRIAARIRSRPAMMVE